MFGCLPLTLQPDRVYISRFPMDHPGNNGLHLQFIRITASRTPWRSGKFVNVTLQMLGADLVVGTPCARRLSIDQNDSIPLVSSHPVNILTDAVTHGSHDRRACPCKRSASSVMILAPSPAAVKRPTNSCCTASLGVGILDDLGLDPCVGLSILRAHNGCLDQPCRDRPAASCRHACWPLCRPGKVSSTSPPGQRTGSRSLLLESLVRMRWSINHAAGCGIRRYRDAASCSTRP